MSGLAGSSLVRNRRVSSELCPSDNQLMSRNLEDALLIVRSPELFCRREAIRHELAQTRSEHVAKKLQRTSKNPELLHLQRGLGLMQSKTLRIGNAVGFGSSQPRLPEMKTKERDHVCDRLIRSLNPVKKTRRWVSLDGLDRSNQVDINRSGSRPDSALGYHRNFQDECRTKSETYNVSRVSDIEFSHHRQRRCSSALNPQQPKLKTPLLPKNRKIPTKEKLLKVVFQEFLEKTDSNKEVFEKLRKTVDNRGGIEINKAEKKVQFEQVFEGSATAEKSDLREIKDLLSRAYTKQKEKKPRKLINLEARLLPSLTLAGNSETVPTELSDLIRLLTQEIPKLKDNKKLLEEIENESFDLESFVKVISESLGEELARALETLKPVITRVEPPGDVSTGTVETEESTEPVFLDAGVMTDFESSSSPELRDVSSQFVLVEKDVGTQYSPTEPIWIEAATSYSRRSSDGGLSSGVSGQLEPAQSYDGDAGELEEMCEPSSPPRDASLLPPPSIDVTSLLEEKEYVLGKIEEVLSGQTSAEQSSFSQILRQEVCAVRDVEVQTEGFRRLRSTTKKVQTFQVLSSSSLTESSSSTLFTCRETTESEEFTAVSGLSLSEGEIPYSRSPGEIPSVPKVRREGTVSVSFVDEMVLADDLPRLLTLETPSGGRAGENRELVMLKPPEEEFSFYVTKKKFGR